MADIEQGSLGTPRAWQLRTIGHAMSEGQLGQEEILDLAINALGGYIGRYAEDLGDDVIRTFHIDDIDEEGWVEFTVRLTGTREPGPRYRLTLKLEGL
jgi:hypothetical protein